MTLETMSPMQPYTSQHSEKDQKPLHGGGIRGFEKLKSRITSTAALTQKHRGRPRDGRANPDHLMLHQAEGTLTD